MLKSRTWVCVSLLLIVGATGLAQPEAVGPELGLDQILTPSESRSYHQKPDYRDRMELFRHVLGRLRDQISVQTKAKEYAAIDQILLAIRSLSMHGIRQAGEPHTPKDARSRKVKRLEIELRRLLESLSDLKLKVHFELRLSFEEVESSLEDFRSDVLGLLFESSNSGFPTEFPHRGERLLISSALLPVLQERRRRGSGIRGDQFTDAEYDKVQDAQKLKDRVKIFMEISESRLVEIERRREGIEWKGDKENPLEFYTLAQMVHAYDRCISGTMIFIDEKATRRLEEEKEIKKALKVLNKKMQEFIPRLEPIRRQAIDDKDEELFIEIRSAMTSSDKALKGSQLGLGAPATK